MLTVSQPEGPPVPLGPQRLDLPHNLDGLQWGPWFDTVFLIRKWGKAGPGMKWSRMSVYSPPTTTLASPMAVMVENVFIKQVHREQQGAGRSKGGRRETFDGDRDGGGEESSVTRETGPGRGGQEGHRASPLRTSLHSLQHLPNGFDRFGLSEDATGSGGLRSLYEAAPMGPELDCL